MSNLFYPPPPPLFFPSRAPPSSLHPPPPLSLSLPLPPFSLRRPSTAGGSLPARSSSPSPSSTTRPRRRPLRPHPTPRHRHTGTDGSPHGAARARDGSLRTSDLKEMSASRSVSLLPVEGTGDDAGTTEPAEDARRTKGSRNGGRRRSSIAEMGAWLLGRWSGICHWVRSKTTNDQSVVDGRTGSQDPRP